MIRQPPRTNGTGNVNRNAATHSQTHVMMKGRLHDTILQRPYHSRRQIAGGELICQLASSSIHPSMHVRGLEIAIALVHTQSRPASHTIAALSFMQMQDILYGCYGQIVNNKISEASCLFFSLLDERPNSTTDI
jgi:hypothetical protein